MVPFLGFWAAWVALAPITRGYRHGDHVTLLKRSQYLGKKTGFSEMTGQHSPHFGVDRVVELNPLFEVQKKTSSRYQTNSAFKMSFSFVNDRFLTPWLTVTDGHGHYLHNIRFTFRYTGHHIKAVDVETDYHPRGAIEVPPEHIRLVYQWEEDVELDSQLGFTAVVAVTCVVSWAAMYMVMSEYCCGSSSVSKRSIAPRGQSRVRGRRW